MPLLPHASPGPVYHYVLGYAKELGYLAPNITTDFKLDKTFVTDDTIFLIHLREKYNQLFCLCLCFSLF